MANKKIEIEIIESTDASVKCIHAIRQVMDYFSNVSPGQDGLSAIGKDKQAVYAWFLNRYNPDVCFNFGIKDNK